MLNAFLELLYLSTCTLPSRTISLTLQLLGLTEDQAGSTNRSKSHFHLDLDLHKPVQSKEGKARRDETSLLCFLSPQSMPFPAAGWLMAAVAVWLQLGSQIRLGADQTHNHRHSHIHSLSVQYSTTDVSLCPSTVIHFLPPHVSKTPDLLLHSLK